LEDRTLLSPGDLDPTFGNGGLVTSDFPGSPGVLVSAVTVQSDTRIVVVGAVQGSSSSSYQFGLTRFNGDGSLDDSFGNAGRVTTGFAGWVRAGATGVAVQPDGRIVVAGGAGNGAIKFPQTVIALARYSSDGSLDPSFGSGGLVTTSFPGQYSANANSMALQPDGGIVVAGVTSTPARSRHLALARYTRDGSLDPSFGSGGLVETAVNGSLGYVTSVAVQGDHIVVGGSEDSGNYRFLVVRYNGDGSPDRSFGTGGQVVTSIPGFDDSLSESVAVQPDGRVLAAGWTSSYTSHDARFALARYASDGSLDPSFGTAGLVTTGFGQSSAHAYAVVVQANGRIVVTGRTDTSGTQLALARYDSDGSLDTSFGTVGLVSTSFPGYSAWALGVALQPDGRIVAAGSAYDSHGPRIGVARYEGDRVGATHFEIDTPVEVIPGQPFDVTVTALDDNGNVVPDYTGTVTLSSTDPLAPALGNHTFTTADGGVYTFTAVRLYTAGPQSLFADDGSLSGQADLTVDPGLAVGLILTGPDHAIAGVPVVVTVSAVDAWGNVATGYAGTVWLSATDPDANLPDAWDFTADDAGTHSFTLTLRTPGPALLTAHDSDAGWDADLDLVVA
jgi:uncharacterized delta-60 repeat protein